MHGLLRGVSSYASSLRAHRPGGRDSLCMVSSSSLTRGRTGAVRRVSAGRLIWTDELACRFPQRVYIGAYASWVIGLRHRLLKQS